MKKVKCFAAQRVAGLGHGDLDPKPRFPGRDQLQTTNVGRCHDA